MRDKKLQVFVSSTFTDLREERQAAVEAILSSGNIPAGMELFSAGDESQMVVIERWIDESDVYLLILGGRYGSIEKKSGKSYTHLEYEYALQKGKPLFAVVITDDALNNKVKTSGMSVMEQDNNNLLKEFRVLVMSNLVKLWDDKKDIKIAIHETLSNFSYQKELTGWVRGNTTVNTAFLAEEIANLTKENSELRAKLFNGDENTALYSKLTYSQLEELLKRQEIEIENKNSNVFDLLLKLGELLIQGISYSKPNEKENFVIKILQRYKLVNFDVDSLSYIFTDDGHSFYLKALFYKPLSKMALPKSN